MQCAKKGLVMANIQHIYQQYQQHLQSHTDVSIRMNVTDDCSAAQYTANGLQTQLQINQFNNGMILSRHCNQGQGIYHSHADYFSHNCALFFMVGGDNHVHFADGKSLLAKAGEVWQLTGDIHNANEQKIIHQQQMQSLHLDFSLEKLSHWQEEGVLSSSALTCSNHQQAQFTQLAKPSLALTLLAQKILQQPYQTDALSCLVLESVTLDFTAHVLRFMLDKPLQTKHKSQIDEVIDIIRMEFTQDLSIAMLARRVGMNECYLKRDFKAQTGLTIGQFIRQLRLDCALDRLLQQKSIKETMYFVGYRHVGHFNALFKQKFGYLPSEIK